MARVTCGPRRGALVELCQSVGIQAYYQANKFYSMQRLSGRRLGLRLK
ncbi:hypothetical protein MAMMFC1_00900 [Methylomusa anaerophila]|uniref:Uncharacterized protein n=1 Tax=Methylomusa anaerophila TaxID=1930071 RepID=A0A348AGQ4_9FIRM|nr:hypothetical protein MAMMFC1_00900 [Methylomusa anaerophila]